ncbi:hypothetical protein PLIIFM63780_009959 [Purpureocillium lilacinum]|nr:hypothetical protein PLICBS_010538 [Purpureocillium lilacinum]GJN86379.1 hypothetical protein PLIIFM63780_009959 [Purpureocillium lilacinum]
MTFLSFRAYTDPLNNSGGSMAPPSIPPPPPPPPPPLNIPPSRARLQLAARLAMHQKNNQAAQPSSGTLHHDDDDDDDNMDPFRDGEDEIDDDLEGDGHRDSGRGSWWRDVVRSKFKADDDSDADDDDEEFGDFAMAEEDKGDDEGAPKVLLRPLAVHPAKESSRGLSGLWPFGSRSDKDKSKQDGGREDSKGEVTVPASREKTDEDQSAVEVKEAANRMSIEEPDDDEDEVVRGEESTSGASK